ncbi:TRAP-type mannitol/chloroaromatic compound transport system, small permease component [Loktanella fryxellensis]|uniref:TRAP transporter small permease protein n=1 Tax=Loktanella fryxellensis TaxID=245187 RepID=A0A1H8AT83_9RHOB|nr:TRAP transporter small permease subunit [Loktanella fryxellensis]SEM73763.1 TRAP-type mannitol/chloroaromatic compound transport system, small permease component [Loktanella fryxellensis]
MLRGLSVVAGAISRLNWLVGQIFSWLALGIVLVCFSVVVLRYVFATSFVWLQDLYIWLNGAMFTAVAAFALLRDDHVRVDIFYRPATMRTRAIVDLIGTILFLLPFCWIVYIYSMPFVLRAWSYFEASSNVGGMPGLFILKSFIIAMVVLIALQGIAMICRSILVLAGRTDLVPPMMAYPETQAHPAAQIAEGLN